MKENMTSKRKLIKVLLAALLLMGIVSMIGCGATQESAKQEAQTMLLM